MAFGPTITLHPGGSRPPSPTQKANILAILSAATAAQFAELTAALASKAGLVMSDTPPEDTTAMWFDTTDGTLAVYYGEAWVVVAGGGGGGTWATVEQGAKADTALQPDENGKLPADKLPAEIDARISVLSGPASALMAADLAANELAVDDERERIVVGRGGGRIFDPFAAMDLFETDLWRHTASPTVTNTAWSRAVKFVSTSPSLGGTFLSVSTTTGYARALRWDGTLAPVSGSGAPGSIFSVNAGTTAASPYNAVFPKFVAIFPCNSAGNNLEAGHIQTFNCQGRMITHIDVRNLPYLELLNIANNMVAHLDLTGLAALSNLNITNNFVRDLDLSRTPALSLLVADGNKLESLDLRGLPLTYVSCPLNRIDTLLLGIQPSLNAIYAGSNLMTSVDISGTQVLSFVDFSYCAITNLDLSAMLSPAAFQLNVNPLTSLRAVGVALGPNSYYSNGSLVDTLLDAAALNQFYTDLAPTDPVYPANINISGNPGALGDDESIAVSKNYTLTGT